MRVAVTGSSGLIGSGVVRALAERGDEAIRVVRPGSRGKGIFWDPAAGQIDVAGLEGVDAVIHLAGEPIVGVWTHSRKRRILQSRVQGTSLIAKTLAALNKRPGCLITASGINYYGNRSPAQEVDETTGKGAGFLADVVEQWEGAAGAAREAGIRVAHARTGLVLAKGEGTLKFAAPVFYAGIGGTLGSGRQIWSWVALDDVVGSYLHLLDHALSGPVNVVAPNPVSNAEFTRVMGQVVHRPTIFRVPAAILRLGGELAEELILSGARIVPRKLLESGYQFRYPELRPALQAVLAGEVAS
jgi:uncharacterized protein (TIGR01777 family)